MGDARCTLQAAAAYTDTHQSEAVTVTAPFWGLDPSIILAMAKSCVASVLLSVLPVIGLVNAGGAGIDVAADWPKALFSEVAESIERCVTVA